MTVIIIFPRSHLPNFVSDIRGHKYTAEVIAIIAEVCPNYFGQWNDQFTSKPSYLYNVQNQENRSNKQRYCRFRTINYYGKDENEYFRLRDSLCLTRVAHNCPRLITLWPSDSRSNSNLEMLVFEERGKPEYPEKNLSEHLSPDL